MTLWNSLLVVNAEHAFVNVDASIAKLNIPRTAHILVRKIAERIRSELADEPTDDPGSDQQLYIGSPTDKAKVWEHRNASRHMNQLFLRMHAKLRIPVLETARSHVWRDKLNTMLIDVVAEIMRTAQFGHTAEVNRRSYTNNALTNDVVASTREFLAH